MSKTKLKPWLLITSVIIGAISNILVTWACTLWSPVYLYQHSSNYPSQSSSTTKNMDPLINEFEERGFGNTIYYYDYDSLQNHRRIAKYHLSSGFPFKCLKIYIDKEWPFSMQDSSHNPSEGITSYDLGLKIPEYTKKVLRLPQKLYFIATEKNQIDLPTQPIWPALILNTIFYTFIWYLTFGIPGNIRLYSRHKKGLCITCKYNLKNLKSTYCPECGTEHPNLYQIPPTLKYTILTAIPLIILITPTYFLHWPITCIIWFTTIPIYIIILIHNHNS